MIDTGLKDKVVLISGANNPRGIGAATARALMPLERAVLPHALCTRLGFAEGCVRRRNTMFAR